MKIVVLGGAGDMGSATVQDLLKFTDGGKSPLLPGIHPRQKNGLCPRRSARRCAKIDASSHVDLVKVMQGHDVAAGALGPFYRFESRWWKQHSLLEWTM